MLKHMKKYLLVIKNSKFGIYKDIVSAYKLIDEAIYIRPYGLAIHVGSQLFDYDVFFQTFSKIKKFSS